MKEKKAMTDDVNAAFEDTLVELDFDQILPVKKLNPTALSSQKFKQIISSIEEIGVIEPLVVHAKSGQYLLLDGHLRLEALKKLHL
jgi:ParB-like chromosome segregation protein Spo0J